MKFSIPVDDLEGVGRNLLDFQVLLLDLQPLPAEPEREALHEGEALQVGHDRRALRRAYVCSNFLSSFWLLSNSWKTLRGPFSAVSKPMFANKYQY